MVIEAHQSPFFDLRRRHLRVVLLDSRRDHHDVRPDHVVCGVALVHLAAEAFEPVGGGGPLQVRSRHLVAEIDEHLRDAAHSDPADADEVDALYALGEHGHHRVCLRPASASNRSTMVAAAWALDAPKFVFIIAWGSAFAAGHVYMFVRGLIELRAHMNTGLWSDFSWSEVRERGGEFWKFIGVVYWQTNIDLLPKHVSVLLAGSLLGPASAGLFRLAREFSTVLTQPALMLREVLFPDLNRSFHADDGHFHPVPFKTALVAGSIGLLFVLVSVFFGGEILGIVGEEYVAASTLLSLLMLAASFDLASASLRAAAYAMGRAGSILRIHVASIITYITMFFLLTPLTGLTGPGLAAILASLLALILTVRLIAKN